MRRRLLLFALLLACNVDRRALDVADGRVVATCDEAFRWGMGTACVLDEPCSRETLDESDCCTDIAVCTGGVLLIEQRCDPVCSCTSDERCAFGRSVCVDSRCQDCPSLRACNPCPPGWVNLTRNGCPTCRCGPPSQCDAPERPCDPASPDRVCYAGATCAEECDATQPGCCSNACAAPGCTGPAPTGCVMPCPPGEPCAVCAAIACECDGVEWRCRPACARGASLTCRVPGAI